ncbi:hypothetical protein [Alkalicoccus urumqiensis]|uniref:Uncharacterized protein n=1 Tax=Alkalicoccus urumqiensis TaxID=1548213 RepID=A0A2P6MJH7_ALKUR|nr:hypothetical protein [Alkalicoccus urumqiensis]PRO66442.1 hypothetical protein C6I21_03630 [Alkalicoccus urumqiensis]
MSTKKWYNERKAQLKKLKRTELEEWVLQWMEQHPGLDEAFSFSHSSKEDEVEAAVRRIRAALKEAQNPFRDTLEAAETDRIQSVLDRAWNLEQDGEPVRAFRLYLVLLDELEGTSFDELQAEAAEALSDMFWGEDAYLAPKEQEEIAGMMMERIKNLRDPLWFDLMSASLPLTKVNPRFHNLFREALETGRFLVLPEKEEFKERQLLILEGKLLELHEDPAVAEAFREKHRSKVPGFLMGLVWSKWERGEMKEALALLDEELAWKPDGMERELLLMAKADLLRDSGAEDAARAFVKECLLGPLSDPAAEGLYNVWKTVVPENAWDKELERLMAEIPMKSHLFIHICMQEGLTGLLKAVCEAEPELILSMYEAFLPEDDAFVYRMIETHVMQEAAKASTRRDYEGLAELLMKYAWITGAGFVKELIELLRKEYPRKRALREELEEVEFLL